MSHDSSDAPKRPSKAHLQAWARFDAASERAGETEQKPTSLSRRERLIALAETYRSRSSGRPSQ